MSVAVIDLEEVKPPRPDPIPSATVAEPKPPPLPSLNKQEFTDAFMNVASCYDFHIPSGAFQGFDEKVKVVRYTPCLLKGLETMMLGGPEPQVTGQTLFLKPLKRGIYVIREGLTLELDVGGYDPRLCVEPSVVGGTFPPALRCSNLGHFVGTNRYSLTGIVPLYLLSREAEKETQRESP